MSQIQIGFICCLSFIILESFQAVYLGAVFQDVDSFLVGTCVFGISIIGCALATVLFRPNEIVASIQAWRIVIALNLFAAMTWVTYFIAIQIIEPAVVFTIFSGMVPLCTVMAGWLGMPEASSPKHRMIDFGNALILLSILVLATITILGLSGFVRGSWLTAVIGLCLSALSGGCMAFVILYSVRLNGRGVGPLSQFGLRFVLYTFLALAAFLIGLDDKGAPTPIYDLVWIILIGLGVIAFPLYLVQKAIPLIHASVIAAMTALGPVMVFFMQLLDGRVDYSKATFIGLTIYIVGALLGVYGTTKPSEVFSLRAENN